MERVCPGRRDLEFFTCFFLYIAFLLGYCKQRYPGVKRVGMRDDLLSPFYGGKAGRRYHRHFHYNHHYPPKSFVSFRFLSSPFPPLPSFPRIPPKFLQKPYHTKPKKNLGYVCHRGKESEQGGISCFVQGIKKVRKGRGNKRKQGVKWDIHIMY